MVRAYSQASLTGSCDAAAAARVLRAISLGCWLVFEGFRKVGEPGSSLTLALDDKDGQRKQRAVQYRLIPAARAVSFPSVQLVSTGGQPLPLRALCQRNSLSFFVFALNTDAEQFVDVWKDAARQIKLEPYEVFGYKSSLESVRKYYLSNLIQKRGQTPQVFACYEITDAIRDTVGMPKYTASAFLLDSAGRVRWSGVGHPDPSELRFLTLVVSDLIKESEAAKSSIR